MAWTRTTSKRDLYQEVTDKIIAALEKGAAPWVKPWTAGAAGFPVNGATDRPYNGINVFLLWGAAAAAGYTVDRWLTFKQAQAAGGTVRKGEKATLVIFWKIGTREEQGDDGQQKTRKTFILRHFNVFNVQQCEGLSPRIMGAERPAGDLTDAERLQRAEAFIAHCKADIAHGGDRAAYFPGSDKITMPMFEAFKDAGAYYSTALHELTHWTGHASRCNRAEAFSGRFGSDAYAAEELVAEMGSAFACAGLGITGALQHPEYIAHWLKILKGDNRAIFTAASKAKEAHGFLMARQPEGAEADHEEEGAEAEAEASA